MKEKQFKSNIFYYLLFSNGDINLSLVFIHSIFQMLLFDLAHVIMEICNNNKVFIGKWAISHFNINCECLQLIFIAQLHATAQTSEREHFFTGNVLFQTFPLLFHFVAGLSFAKHTHAQWTTVGWCQILGFVIKKMVYQLVFYLPHCSDRLIYFTSSVSYLNYLQMCAAILYL